jgi:hypothetical protein
MRVSPTKNCVEISLTSWKWMDGHDFPNVCASSKKHKKRVIMTFQMERTTDLDTNSLFNDGNKELRVFTWSSQNLQEWKKIVQTEATPNDVGELAIDINTTVYFTLYCIYTDCESAQMCAYWPTISILVSTYTKRIACKKLLVWYKGKVSYDATEHKILLVQLMQLHWRISLNAYSQLLTATTGEMEKVVLYLCSICKQKDNILARSTAPIQCWNCKWDARTYILAGECWGRCKLWPGMSVLLLQLPGSPNLKSWRHMR